MEGCEQEEHMVMIQEQLRVDHMEVVFPWLGSFFSFLTSNLLLKLEKKNAFLSTLTPFPFLTLVILLHCIHCTLFHCSSSCLFKLYLYFRQQQSKKDDVPIMKWFKTSCSCLRFAHSRSIQTLLCNHCIVMHTTRYVCGTFIWASCWKKCNNYWWYHLILGVYTLDKFTVHLRGD